MENISNIAKKCGQVVAVDNTPLLNQSDFPSNDNVLVVRLGENVGLASALNLGVELAAARNFENVFLFDQDSSPPEGYIAKMLEFKHNVEENGKNWAFYVPNFYDRNSNTFAKFPTLSRFSFRHASCENSAYFKRGYVCIAITSGTLLACSRFFQIGSFRDDYFIDFIDNEYCLRAAKLGLEIAVNCGVVLNHAIGKRETHRFWGLTLKPNHHLPIRRYYIARNGLKTAMEYFGNYPSYLPLVVARMIHEFFSILLYEAEKARKVRALFWGFCHALTGNMGKCKMDL
jgi:rhamnosyltransferase